MAVGLLSNASSSFGMTADAVTAGHTVAIEALSFVLGNNGGRQVRGQLFVDPDAAAQVNGYSQGTPATTYDSGGLPISVFDEHGAPLTVYSQGTLIGLIGPEPVRIDFIATLQDAAFEEYDIFGGQRSPRSDRTAVRF